MKLHWTDNGQPAKYFGIFPLTLAQNPYKWVGSHPETGEVLAVISSGILVYHAEVMKYPIRHLGECQGVV